MAYKKDMTYFYDNMPKRSQTDVKALQQKAQELSDEGYGKAEIAQKLNVSIRTLQRWEKSRLGMDGYTFEHLEKIVPEINQEPQENQQFSLNDMALSLCTTTSTQSTLNAIQGLMPRAITVVGAILDSPTTTSRDKLKAAQLASEWTGHSKGLSFSLHLAMELVSSYGYIITEPIRD